MYDEFMDQVICFMCLLKVEVLLNKYWDQGDYLLIIIVINCFIIGFIVYVLGVDDIIVIDVEIINNCYSGKISGIFCF